MVLFLSFPPELDEACIGNTKSYTVHPTFTVPCAGGTLFIFTCLDDLFFCHEAHFEEQVLKSAGATGYRFVFVFRWLTSARCFYTQPDKKFAMLVPPELHEKVMEAKKKKVAAKRRRSM